MANVKPTKGGFVSCDCKTVSTKTPTTGAGCNCQLFSDFDPKKNVAGQRAFRIRKLKGITNVVVRRK